MSETKSLGSYILKIVVSFIFLYVFLILNHLLDVGPYGSNPDPGYSFIHHNIYVNSVLSCIRYLMMLVIAIAYLICNALYINKGVLRDITFIFLYTLLAYIAISFGASSLNYKSAVPFYLLTFIVFLFLSARRVTNIVGKSAGDFLEVFMPVILGIIVFALVVMFNTLLDIKPSDKDNFYPGMIGISLPLIALVFTVHDKLSKSIAIGKCNDKLSKSIAIGKCNDKATKFNTEMKVCFAALLLHIAASTIGIYYEILNPYYSALVFSLSIVSLIYVANFCADVMKDM